MTSTSPLAYQNLIKQNSIVQKRVFHTDFKRLIFYIPRLNRIIWYSIHNQIVWHHSDEDIEEAQTLDRWSMKHSSACPLQYTEAALMSPIIHGVHRRILAFSVPFPSRKDGLLNLKLSFVSCFIFSVSNFPLVWVSSVYRISLFVYIYFYYTVLVLLSPWHVAECSNLRICFFSCVSFLMLCLVKNFYSVQRFLSFAYCVSVLLLYLLWSGYIFFSFCWFKVFCLLIHPFLPSFITLASFNSSLPSLQLLMACAGGVMVAFWPIIGQAGGW